VLAYAAIRCAQGLLFFRSHLTGKALFIKVHKCLQHIKNTGKCFEVAEHMHSLASAWQLWIPLAERWERSVCWGSRWRALVKRNSPWEKCRGV